MFVALLYGVFISNKEEAIRNYLKNSAEGVIRGIYVNAFVSAVRGKDKVSDTSIIAYLLLSMFFITALYVHSNIREIISDHDSSIKAFEELKAGEQSLTEEEIQSQMEGLEKRVYSTDKDVEKIRVFNDVLYVGSFVGLYFGLLIWRPYLLMRKRFSHEMDIYLHRIQGLASKPELSKLAILESQVTDEQTLQKFIDVTKEIAARHEVVELVTTFDLWSNHEDHT